MSEQDRLIREEAQLQRYAGKTARKLWAQGRQIAGIVTWTTKPDLKRVQEYAEVAYGQVEARDIFKAVEQLSREAGGAPWLILERARDLSAQRRELEHLARKMDERKYEREHMPDIKRILRGGE